MEKDRFGYFLECLYRVNLMPASQFDMIEAELDRLDIFVEGLRQADGLTPDERYSMKTLINLVRKRKRRELDGLIQASKGGR